MQKTAVAAVAWEVEKATLVRDLTPRERGLVLTFSDPANFRAAVAALVRMRGEVPAAVAAVAGAASAAPAFGSPPRLRVSGVRV